ncbi:hypothetical protein GJR96_00595 [Haloferax sp. MBLA0076]|uniref:Uncharacterized protein n=1 Tax=Haloferax litoreum TaxID=2666140 RepID=A0A6A8GE79_9EURY|nr:MULTISPECIES: hypothetical protein [Haloferax]KAB1192015.1 hypothetical protein Hfx1148_00595 [Haloferax sp. CBA1148]MRX20457.1 hypothetical protein [Haloferax litoreum]
MTAIFAMCLKDGAFIAADSLVRLPDGSTRDIQDTPEFSNSKITKVSEQLVLTSSGAVDTDFRLIESLKTNSPFDTVDEIGSEISKLTRRDHQRSLGDEENQQYDREQLDFLVQFGGIDPASGTGFVGNVVTRKTQNRDPYEPFISKEPGWRLAAGTNHDLITTVSDQVASNIKRQQGHIAPDRWASTSISEISKQSDNVSLPAHLVSITQSNGYYFDEYDTPQQKRNTPFDVTI